MALDKNGQWWWHSIALPDGSVTPGQKSLEILESEWASMRVPDLRGKTVLDIGAWDGWFSFKAEQSGAARVMALDYFTWSLDFGRQEEYAAYIAKCAAEGVGAVQWGPGCPFWDNTGLPGKRRFDIARKALNSRVQDFPADFVEADLRPLGTFDVVFFLGVFYHLQEPLAALRKLRQLTNELAIIETAAIHVPDEEDKAMLRFTPLDEVNQDGSNWWFPNDRAMHDLLKTAGFPHVETVGRTAATPAKDSRLSYYRLTLQARTA